MCMNDTNNLLLNKQKAAILLGIFNKTLPWYRIYMSVITIVLGSQIELDYFAACKDLDDASSLKFCSFGNAMGL